MSEQEISAQPTVLPRGGATPALSEGLGGKVLVGVLTAVILGVLTLLWNFASQGGVVHLLNGATTKDVEAIVNARIAESKALGASGSLITTGKWTNNAVETTGGSIRIRSEVTADNHIKLIFDNKFKSPPYVLATSISGYRVFVESINTDYAILGTQEYPNGHAGTNGTFWFVVIPSET